MKTFLLIPFLALLLLASCKKNPDQAKNATSQQNCLLQKYAASDNSYIEYVYYDGNNNVKSVGLVGAGATSLVLVRDSNNHNRVLAVKEYNGGPNVAELLTYKYDANNRIDTVYLGSSTNIVSRLYNNNYNRPYEENTCVFINNGYFVRSKVVYTYDSHGNVATSTTGGITDSFKYDNKPNALKAFDFLTDAVYGNSNNVTSDIGLDFNGNVYNYLKSTYTYDSNGNVTQKQDEQYNGTISIYNYTFLCH